MQQMFHRYDYDWFILAAASDRAWAEWAATELQQAGYRVAVPWDLLPGSNIVLMTGEMLDQSERCLILLSEAFEQDPSTKFPLSVFLQRDPTFQSRLILPLLIERTKLTGYLSTLIYLDMTSYIPYQSDAQTALIEEIHAISTGSRKRSGGPPSFPGSRLGNTTAIPTAIQSMQGTSRSTVGATAARSCSCPQCHTRNKAGAKFCNTCGCSLTTGLATSTQPVAISYPTAPSQTGQLRGTLHNGQYLIIRPLGQGGMGAVYLAKDLSFGGRQVAVKEMSQDHLQIDEIADAADAFKHEAMMLGHLRHSNLPRIYAHFEDGGRWYLVMDYIEGETLEDLLVKTPTHRLPVEDILEIGLQLCTVLGYLHTRKPPIIFRDLKPSNIMLEGETVYLIDFGIARHFKVGQSKDTAALGSQGYAAPEQYGKSQTTPRSDLYSLGATLYYLLSGDDPSGHPFRFPSLAKAGGLLATGHPALQDLDVLLQSMVEVDEQKRPKSAVEVRQELLRIASVYAQPAPTYNAIISSSLPQPVPQSRGSAGAAPGLSPQAASWIGLRQVTLLYAQKDTPLAQELEAHLLAATQSAGLPLKVCHNAATGPGTVIAQIWADRLQNSDVFVPLISADIWGPKDIWGYVQEVLLTKKAEQIVPVLVRACLLDQGKFQGLNVVPNKPVSSFSGAAAKENAWLSVVNHIIQAVKARSLTHQSSPVVVSSQISSVQTRSIPPSPASTRRVSVQESQPLFSSSATPSPTSSLQKPASPATALAAPPSSKEWEITLLFAPEDKHWVTPMTRVFTIMQRTLLSSLDVRFIIHHGAEGLQGDVDKLLEQRIATSRLTLALVSPDFLASEWMDQFNQLNTQLRSRGHSIIPILLRNCEWQGGVALPRGGAIGRVGNDTAWTEVSKEIRTVLEGYYPREMPQRRITPWS